MKKTKKGSMLAAIAVALCAIAELLKIISWSRETIILYRSTFFSLVVQILCFIAIAVVLIKPFNKYVLVGATGILALLSLGAITNLFSPYTPFFFIAFSSKFFDLAWLVAIVSLAMTFVLDTVPPLQVYADKRNILKKISGISAIATLVFALSFFIADLCTWKVDYFWTTYLTFAVQILFLFAMSAYAFPREKRERAIPGDKGVNAYAAADGAEALDNDCYVSLGKHICLMFFTFGIWYMIWICRATRFTNAAKGENERNPITKLLLCLFVPFYMIYWTYKTALRIDKIAKARGISSDLGAICLVLAIFVSFVPPILMQDKINQCITGNGGEVKAPVTDTAEELKKLKELLDAGILTQEEFDAKKKQLLGL